MKSVIVFVDAGQGHNLCILGPRVPLTTPLNIDIVILDIENIRNFE